MLGARRQGGPGGAPEGFGRQEGPRLGPEGAGRQGGPKWCEEDIDLSSAFFVKT